MVDEIIQTIAMMSVLITAIGVTGWVITTRMRIKNGYPLSGAWGQSQLPHQAEETVERVKLIGSENAQLRAELSSVKDRLATVERIVTDRGLSLADEIDALTDRRSN